jgi:hypothetical protein
MKGRNYETKLDFMLKFWPNRFIKLTAEGFVYPDMDELTEQVILGAR